MRTIKRAAALTRKAAAVESGGQSSRSQNRDKLHRDESAVGADSGGEVSVAGGDIIMRSVLIDAISTIRKGPASLRDAAGGGSYDRREIAQLASAWARLNQGHVEEEKLRLKTQSTEEIAFDALGKEIRDMPETKELLKKLHEVFKREEAAKEVKTGDSPRSSRRGCRLIHMQPMYQGFSEAREGGDSGDTGGDGVVL